MSSNSIQGCLLNKVAPAVHLDAHTPTKHLSSSARICIGASADKYALADKIRLFAEHLPNEPVNQLFA